MNTPLPDISDFQSLFWFVPWFDDHPTDLQEALHMAGRVFRPGSIVAVREQNHHPVLQQPFGFTCRRQRLWKRLQRRESRLEAPSCLPPEMKVSKMICAPLKKSPNWASQIGRSLGWAMLIPYSKPRTASSDSGLLHTYTGRHQSSTSKERQFHQWWHGLVKTLPLKILSARGWYGWEGCTCHWCLGTPPWRGVGWTCLFPHPDRWFWCWSLSMGKMWIFSDFWTWSKLLLHPDLERGESQKPRLPPWTSLAWFLLPTSAIEPEAKKQ